MHIFISKCYNLGLEETRFKKNDLLITLVDVGGQRSERKKWLKCFDGVDAVIFVASMSEYDQTLIEDKMINRMQESLKVFSQICNSKHLSTSSILLFLNKQDVFNEKIVYSPLNKCFPGYDGPREKYAAAIYIRQQFKDQNISERELYCHYTNAKDTRTVKVIFEVMVDIIIHGLITRVRME